jgi:hypothetical protein
MLTSILFFESRNPKERQSQASWDNSFKKGAVHQAQERDGACEIEGGGTVQKKSGRGI